MDDNAERRMEKKTSRYVFFNRAPSMNEAKEYDSLESYHLRDDKKYKQKIDETLSKINVFRKIIKVEVKKVAAEKMREEERKEHPREK